MLTNLRGSYNRFNGVEPVVTSGKTALNNERSRSEVSLLVIEQVGSFFISAFKARLSRSFYGKNVCDLGKVHVFVENTSIRAFSGLQ